VSILGIILLKWVDKRALRFLGIGLYKKAVAVFSLGMIMCLLFLVQSCVAPENQKERSLEINEVLSQVNELKQHEKPDEALDLLKKTRKKYPASLDLNAETYRLLLSLGRYEDCLKFIDETLPVTPEEYKQGVIEGKNGPLLSLLYKSLENKNYDKAFLCFKEMAESGWKQTSGFLLMEEFAPLREKQGFNDIINMMMKNAGIGNRPFDFTVTLINNEEYTLSERGGKVVLVDFWATYCMPCIKSFPYMKDIYERYKDKGFEIITLNLDGSKETFENYIAKSPMPWKQAFLVDGFNNPVAKAYRISGIPYSFLIDRSGIMRYCDVREEQLAEAVSALLNE